MQKIRINSLNKKFQNLEVLKDFSIEFSGDKIHCLFGPSGCGKTTLLQLISGLTAPDRGTINGIAGRSVSYVFQEDRLLPWATVKENIMFVLDHKATNKQKAEQISEKYLALVGLSQFRHYFPDQLSGGMKQRVAIARAFAYQGDILLLDEPFKGLDYELKKCLMDYILAYWRRHKPLCLFVTHDPDEGLYLADTIHVFSGPPLGLTKQLVINIPHQERLDKPAEIAELKRTLLAPNKAMTEQTKSRC
ncbi:MAG: ABC transporter ATP-binding protein [Clostridia bacterium]|nr:ABC transporter ATP-binding protein [Clostridia bacterium]